MTNTCELVSKQILSSDANSITFTNIPQNYTDLYFVHSARTTRTNSNWDGIRVSINGTGNTGLSTRSMYGYSSTVGSNTDVNGSFGMAATDAGTASTFGNSSVYIPNYTASTNKSMSVEGVSETNAASSLVWAAATLWSNTAAISTLQLFTESGSDFKAGSAFYLYGVRSANFAPGVFMSASGGDQVTISGGYKYHVFRSSGQLTVAQPGWVEVLVVGGGGGGNTAGGGAGGHLARSVYIPSGPQSIIVGGGGAGNNTMSVPGFSGSDSSLGSLLTASGGGGGGGFSNTVGLNNGLSGGSGGGAGGSDNGGNPGTPGSGVSGQGFAGGNAVALNTNQGRGGGGGAGGVGGNGSGTTSGAGGPGATWLDGVIRAGGGGGGSNGGTAGAGGSGGGGAGANQATGTAGTANTGGGGGGGLADATRSGAAGGSGIVIVRYPVT